jgi:hypothetical protein
MLFKDLDVGDIFRIDSSGWEPYLEKIDTAHFRPVISQVLYYITECVSVTLIAKANKMNHSKVTVTNNGGYVNFDTLHVGDFFLANGSIYLRMKTAPGRSFNFNNKDFNDVEPHALVQVVDVEITVKS